MSNSTRDEEIAEIVAYIERSPLSVEEYIQQNGVPFSLAQFYRYRARFTSEGKDGLSDKRREGNHHKLNKEHLAFIKSLSSRIEIPWPLREAVTQSNSFLAKAMAPGCWRIRTPVYVPSHSTFA